MARRTVQFILMFCLVLASGCTMIDPNVHAQARRYQLEPEAGQWQTWVLDEVDSVLPAAPPSATASKAEIEELKALAAARGPEDEAQVVYWNAGAPNYRWAEIAGAAHAQAQIGATPRFARSMALLNVAIYDATVAAWKAKYAYNRPRPSTVDSRLTPLANVPDSPSYPSERAVAAGAAATILSYLFPDQAADFTAKAEAAARAQLLAGVNYPSDVAAGLELGRAVAEQVIARAMADGSDAVWDGVMPTEPGHWTGENPVQPTSGSWQTWVLTSGDQLRPPPPPAYDSEQMQVELTALKTMTATMPHTMAAYFWQSPRGLFSFTYATVGRLIFEHGLDVNPPQAARIYAAMSVGQYDAFVGCYDAKYAYWSMRPSQVDPTFKPLLPNPNFPSYPSAHSCQSTAVATVLGAFFPEDAAALMANAEEAGNSRMWGGIHFQSDIDAGMELGIGVGELVTARDREMAQVNR